MMRWVMVCVCVGGLWACGPKAKVVSKDAPASSGAAEPAEPRGPRGLGSLPPESDSICRAFKVPDGLDLRGCTVRGPYPGELQGAAIGPERPFAEALAACLVEPRCSGVTSDWYLDAPWRLMAADAPFAPDQGSYGCALVVGACP